jgi:hypothetical protein
MVDHVASFVGFLPASRPAVVILVSLDTPRGPRNQGGDVAAPLFARIAEQAVRRLAVTPDDPERRLQAAAYRPSELVPAAHTPAPVEPSTAAAEPGVMPDLRGRSAREAAIMAARRGLIVELKGSGTVLAQAPEPGSAVEPGVVCRLDLGQVAAGAPTLLPGPARGGLTP